MLSRETYEITEKFREEIDDANKYLFPGELKSNYYELPILSPPESETKEKESNSEEMPDY
ncbi:hypothetical protein HN832_03270 [archaeon]|jgi:hypothetical protein|nr:hypothetical protein [archaeon]MBT4373583.1 hypothetical protein [archaeon]MBT4532031.1 hypothetical protein [archaeon]MBT7001698.1 hypothetical protein [archaeon]MBT7282410.1 hypothetical protein [archaeon]